MVKKHRWRLVRHPQGGSPEARCTRCGVLKSDRSKVPLPRGWVVVPWKLGGLQTVEDCEVA